MTIIPICVYLAMIVYCIVGIIKVENAFRNSTLIDRAICMYQLDMINADNFNFEVDYTDEESLDSTIKRWWDWGYTRILPPEKFEIIKPYIEKAKEAQKR